MATKSSRRQPSVSEDEGPRNTASVPAPATENNYLNTDCNFYDDGSLTFFWRPHSLIAAGMLVLYFLFNAFDDSGPRNNYKGLVAVCGVFIVTCIVHFRDGPFYRPHPAIWRAVHAMTVLYLLGLVYLLFQTPEDGRKLFKHYDEKLGEPLELEDYAEDCRVYVPDHPTGNPFYNFMEKMDRFVWAHTIGWLVKALIIRHTVVCHVISILFEFLEYSLTFHLPNFNECWWDHWILDAAVCNAAGIYLGMKLCKYLQFKSYHWRGMYSVPSYSGKLKRAVAQFTPYYWTPFDWDAFHDIKTWLATLFIVFITLTCDLTAFYLKAVLWLPSSCPLNIYRLFLMAGAAAVSVREIYQFAHDPDCKRFGQQAWVVMLILITEILVSIKYGRDQFTNSPDPVWVAFWGVLVLAVGLWTIYFAVLPVLRKSPTKEAIKSE